jgi:serine protease Do
MLAGRSVSLALLGAAALAMLLGAQPALAAPEPGTRPASDAQRIALQVKPAVVRIYDGCEGAVRFAGSGKTYDVPLYASGSGFFINPDGYIVTNAHVATLTKQGSDVCKERLLTAFLRQLATDYHEEPDALLNNRPLVTRILQQSTLERFQPVHHVVLPDGTALPFDIKAFGTPTSKAGPEGKDVAILKVQVKHAPTLRLGTSDTLQTLDPVLAVGYPAAADTGALTAKARLEATFTDGKLSAIKQLPDGVAVLQHSAPTAPGNSGGPVLDAKGEVVGITTFGPQGVSGFAFAVPTSTILEFVRQAGTTNDSGPTDQRYREGLDLYRAGDYRKAIATFEEVKRLFPLHSEVDKLVQMSQQQLAPNTEKLDPAAVEPRAQDVNSASRPVEPLPTTLAAASPSNREAGFELNFVTIVASVLLLILVASTSAILSARLTRREDILRRRSVQS